jgi:hypothetical protein
MSTNGIDLSGSGWDNPEGFVRAPRPSTPAPPVPPACEAVGPDGWTCDRRPHPDGEYHKADDGSPHGLRWTTEMADASVYGTPVDEPVLISGRITILDPEHVPTGNVTVGDVLEEIALLAETALKAESPAAWVLALDKIRAAARS